MSEARCRVIPPDMCADVAQAGRREDPRAAAVALAAAWARIRNHADAQIARAIAAAHAATPADPEIPRPLAVAAEIGLALRLGSGAADRLVSAALALTGRLSGTLAEAETGRLSWPKAVTLAEATATLDDEQATAVQRRVLPWAAERTPAQHLAALRRAVDRVDPPHAERRRHQAEADIALLRAHHGAGMGELFARMPSEEVDLVWTAADAWARRAKAAGDVRPLDRLRVAALADWACAFLTGPDAPRRHGRPLRVEVLTTVAALDGDPDAPAELTGSGTPLTTTGRTAVATSGPRMRRLLVDDDTGELLDLSAAIGTDGGSPYELSVVMTVAERAAALEDPDLPASVHVLASLPVTAGRLDAAPAGYRAGAELAGFVAARDRHPVNPCAGLTPAAAADLDHTVPAGMDGPTIRDNLASVVRRWHRLRTHGGWQVLRVGRGWRWTSPGGQVVGTRPFDYRPDRPWRPHRPCAADP